MCGIMGWSFNQNCSLTLRQRALILQHAAFGADKRGGQSWGILTVDQGKPRVSRGLGALVARNFRKLAQHPFGFAHSRYATKGEVTVENSHPFEIGTIIGAHNGVLSNAFELDKEFGDEPVDSRHIFKAIDAGRTLDDLEGYGVIEFWDRKYAATIQLADIGHGSVTLFELPGEQGYVWTSLKDDGELALESVGADRQAKIVTMKEGVAYAIIRDHAVYETELKLQLNSPHAVGFQTQWDVYNQSDIYKPQSYRSRKYKWDAQTHTGKWEDDTGDYDVFGMTKEEKAELREELKESWEAEKAEAANVEKEWTIGGEPKAVEEEETNPGFRVIVAV